MEATLIMRVGEGRPRRTLPSRLTPEAAVPSRVLGSNRAKTYGSDLSYAFQSLTSGVIGNFPKNDAWLTRGNVVQLLHRPVAASTNFPEKAHYRESLPLIVVAACEQ